MNINHTKWYSRCKRTFTRERYLATLNALKRRVLIFRFSRIDYKTGRSEEMNKPLLEIRIRHKPQLSYNEYARAYDITTLPSSRRDCVLRRRDVFFLFYINNDASIHASFPVTACGDGDRSRFVFVHVAYVHSQCKRARVYCKYIIYAHNIPVYLYLSYTFVYSHYRTHTYAFIYFCARVYTFYVYLLFDGARSRFPFSRQI